MEVKDRWYVVQTKYKQEQAAIDNLIKQRFNVFFPQISEKKTIRNKLVTVLSPMFNSYLFVEFNIGRDRWRAISGTRGVSQLVTATDERVSPLPDGFVEELKKQGDGWGIVPKQKADETLMKYAVGDTILIRNGIFEGVTGTYLELNGDKITILLTLLKNKNPITLPVACVL